METIGYVILIGVVLAFLWRPFLRGLRGEDTAKRSTSEPQRRDGVQELVDAGKILFPASVAGESHYQANIRQVVKVGKRVRLVPEPKNPHDKNAVRVDVDGLPIGYIPRDKAREAKRKNWEAIVAAVNAEHSTIGVVLGVTCSDGESAPSRPL